MLLLLFKSCQWDVCTGRRCPAKETVFGSLPNFCCPGKEILRNRIGHPDWVKLCVELNCAPNQNTFCYTVMWVYLLLFQIFTNIASPQADNLIYYENQLKIKMKENTSRKRNGCIGLSTEQYSFSFGNQSIER